MRPLMKYNGIKWIHEYQNACVDKIERFLKSNLEKGDVFTDNSRKLESSLSQGTLSTGHVFQFSVICNTVYIRKPNCF